MRIAAILVALAAIIAILVFLWRKPNLTPIDPAPPVAPSPSPSPEEISATPLEFQRQLIVESSRLVFDGKALDESPCDPAKPGAVLGSIEVAAGAKARLTCASDATGGIFLSIEGSEAILLAQAGESERSGWDTRTWIERKDDVVTIKRATICSAEDEENPGPVDCNRSAELIQFDPSRRVFTPTRVSFESAELDFVPPVSVDERCVNP